MIRLCNQTLMIKRAQMNLQKLYIYGHGGHGRVVADIAVAAGYRDIRFLDDAHGQKFDACLPKGNIIVTVGDNAVRQRLGQKVSAAGFRLVSLIHHAAVCGPHGAHDCRHHVLLFFFFKQKTAYEIGM